MTKCRKTVPPNVAAAVARALEKSPADRFESAKRFADAPDNPAFRADGQLPVAATGVAAARGFSRGSFAGVATLAMVASAVAIWGWLRSRPLPPPPSVRYQLSLFMPSQGEGPWRHLALSTDGMTIAFTQSRGGVADALAHDARRAAAEPLAGTEEGVAPTFSHDAAGPPSA